MRMIDGQNKRQLKDIVSPFNLNTRINITGIALASFVAISSFFLMRPQTDIQWTLKIVEVIGIFLACYAITSIIKNFMSTKQNEFERSRLEQIAKSKKMTLDEYLQTQIDEVTKSIEKWAKIHRVGYRRLNYSKYKSTIDFKDFIIDFIDIHVANYNLLFTVRICEDNIVKNLLSYMNSSEIKIAMILDSHYIGPETNIKINADNLCKIKSTLIDSILNPIHTKLYL